MKKILTKFLVAILIVLIITNFVVTNISFAYSFEEFLMDIFGTVVGLLTYPIRLTALGIAWGIEELTNSIAYSQGTVDANGNIIPDGSMSGEIITPFDILFNKIALTDINFFNIPNDGSVISKIRTAIAAWYYVMRNIAAIILLCVFIYVGIRMAISTIASDKAMYKKMLVDWICSLALIFLIQYIIIFTLNVNDAFIKGLSGISDTDAFSVAMEEIRDIATDLFGLDSIAATIVYCMFIAQTIGLLFSYFNRMLKLAFLIIISPLITLTYSIDKMGDGKAQALGTWMKEFIFTVLLQPFHCVIYMVFINMALMLLEGYANSMAAAIIAMLCVKFTKKGEELLGKIFNFSDSTSDTSIGAGMVLAGAALSKAKDIGKTAKSTVNGVKNIKSGAAKLGRNAKTDMMALAAMRAASKEGKEKSFAEAKEEAEAKVTEKEAAKQEKKNSKKYGVSTKDKAYQKDISKRANELMKNSGMSKSMAFATARKEKAEKERQAQKNKKHPTIAKARGTISSARRAIRQIRSTETYKQLAEIGKSYVAAGAGLAIGSFTYGTSGNAATAIAAGTATYKASQEFMQASTSNVVNTADQILHSLGANTKEDAQREMETTQAMAPILSDNEELQRYIDDLLKFVDSAISDVREARTVKNSIRNTVASEIKKNPEIKPDDLMKKIKEKQPVQGNLAALTANGNAFNDAVNEVARTQRRKELYDTMQNASDIGLNPETFSSMVCKGFSNGGVTSDFKSNDTVTKEIKDGKDFDRTDFDERRTTEGCEKVVSEIEQEIKDAERRIEVEKDLLTEEEVEDIRSQQEHLKKNMPAMCEELKKRYEKEVDEIQKEYGRKVEELRQLAKQEATAKATKALEEEADRVEAEGKKIEADYTTKINNMTQKIDEYNSEI